MRWTSDPGGFIRDDWYLQLCFPRAISLVPSLADVGQVPGGSVQPGKPMLGADYELICVFGARIGDVGGDTKTVSDSSRHYGEYSVPKKGNDRRAKERK